MKLVIYDIETIVNLITLCYKDKESGKKREFVLFDDSKEFVKLYRFLCQLRDNNYILFGFNNISFDNQIIEFILYSGESWIVNNTPIEQIVKEIYYEAQRVINLPQEIRFKELLPEYRFSIKAVDIFKQKHYDGKAKMGTSLKWVQFTMDYWNIEEMPIPHDVPVKKEDIPKVLSYNWNDVDSTEAFYDKNKFETDLRVTLSERYGINLINASEPRISKDVFGKFLSEAMNISYKELKELRTYRDIINVKDIIFNYTKFKNSTLQNLLTTLNKTILRPDEGFEKVFKIGNIEVTFGLGGLHSNNIPYVSSSKDGKIIKSCDVKSMYPNLAIRNKLKPEHLGDTFLTVYENIYNERIGIPKSDPINYVFKIILNSTYGLSGEPNSYLYDVQFTRAICINGQLSLLMLADMFLDRIPDLEILMMNTDGMEVRFDEKYKDEYEKICKEWEQITKLELEFADYQKMIVRDVNNYIAIDSNGDVKRKGAFCWKVPKELDYHKNPSFTIIPKAIDNYFVNGVSVEKTIEEQLKSGDIFPFLAATKKKKDFDLLLYKIENGNLIKEEQQKVTRFYISKTKGKLLKNFHSGKSQGKKILVIADWDVKTINIKNDETINDFYKNVNLLYYITEAKKRIHEIEGNSQQLTLFYE